MSEQVWNFPSTGNAEQDETEAARIRRSMELRDKGLCPNDETPLQETGEPNTKECPKCGFIEVRSTLHVGQISD